jgi:hypothetical protein
MAALLATTTPHISAVPSLVAISFKRTTMTPGLRLSRLVRRVSAALHPEGADADPPPIADRAIGLAVVMS